MIAPNPATIKTYAMYVNIDKITAFVEPTLNVRWEKYTYVEWTDDMHIGHVIIGFDHFHPNILNITNLIFQSNILESGLIISGVALRRVISIGNSISDFQSNTHAQ